MPQRWWSLLTDQDWPHPRALEGEPFDETNPLGMSGVGHKLHQLKCHMLVVGPGTHFTNLVKNPPPSPQGAPDFFFLAVRYKHAKRGPISKLSLQIFLNGRSKGFSPRH